MKSRPFISEETMTALQEGLEDVKKDDTKLEKTLLKLSAVTFCEHCKLKILGLLDESESVI